MTPDYGSVLFGTRGIEKFTLAKIITSDVLATTVTFFSKVKKNVQDETSETIIVASVNCSILLLPNFSMSGYT